MLSSGKSTTIYWIVSVFILSCLSLLLKLNLIYWVLFFPGLDCAEEARAFELPGSRWLSRLLQPTGSLSGYDEL